jgi:endothelin-converting enzyme/putative endopeptidase
MLGENVADLGGLKLGYAAFERYLKDHPAAVQGERLTPKQAFFVGYAQAWCAKVRPEQELQRVTTDPHAPPYWRVNGPMSNLKAFQETFQCKAGDKMVSAHPCEVW